MQRPINLMPNLTGQDVCEKNAKPKRGNSPGKDERNHWAYEYGTDAQFLAWVSKQPSVIDGSWNQRNPDRNIACHVRRITDGAGMGIKPPFSAVPMTQIQHAIQSGENGEARVLYYNFILDLPSASDAAEWFESARDATLRAWVEHRKVVKAVAKQNITAAISGEIYE